MSKSAEIAKEARQKTVDQIVADMEAAEAAIAAGKPPQSWTKSWKSTSILPTNVRTGKRYRGGNILAFWMTAMLEGWDSPVWGTAKQWHQCGARIKDGEFENYTVGIYWNIKKRIVENDDGELEEKSFSMLRHFRVYNLEQTEVVTQEVFDRKAHIPEPPPEVDRDGIPGIDVFEAVPFQLKKGEPAYSPSKDVVYMPEPGEFHNLEHFSATMAHELTHWTGHKSRLDREQKSRGDIGAYAFEELVAELGAVFMGHHIGVAHVTREDHVAYLRSWIKHLKDDPQALYTAATKADAAFEHLIAYSEAEEVSKAA